MNAAVDTMMPCAAETTPIGDEEALLLGLQIRALRDVDTRPGSGDRAFIQDLRGRHPKHLTDRQRAYVRRLAWRYRAQLAPMLRPDTDPEALPPQAETV